MNGRAFEGMRASWMTETAATIRIGLGVLIALYAVWGVADAVGDFFDPTNS